MATTYYAWSDLYNGGKTIEVDRPGGGSRTVMAERNIVARGEKVTQKNLGVSDEEFQALVEGGSVRPYPLPAGSSDTVSPSRAMLDSLMDRTGELDVNRLLELGLSHPPAINPPSDEAEDVPVGA
jgi:hypothetical protein